MWKILDFGIKNSRKIESIRIGDTVTLSRQIYEIKKKLNMLEKGVYEIVDNPTYR